MRFDKFTVSLLILRPDAPRLDEAAESRLQDAHMAALADAHDTCRLTTHWLQELGPDGRAAASAAGALAGDRRPR